MNIQISETSPVKVAPVEKELLIDGNAIGYVCIYEDNEAKHRKYHVVLNIEYEKITGKTREIAQGLGATVEEAMKEAMKEAEAMVLSFVAGYNALKSQIN